MQALEVLRRTFGHAAFREGQEAIVSALLSGRDALGVMPTGAGKSVCYQVPALMLAGIALVISPLISLMKDQVAALKEIGVPSAYLNSSLTPSQYDTALARAREGRYKILYVAPERLEATGFLSFALGAHISLIAVDEAHCVSQWGQDFRPSYLKIAAFIDKLPVRPAVGAFTATATAQVKTDIARLLKLRAPLTVTTGFDRPNLFFDVAKPKDKMGYLLHFIAARPGQSGIVYCATRAGVEKVCALLQGAGVAATRYHAGLSDAERRRNQEDFVFDRARVMAATNAFGMGIDKSNVSFVVHCNMPKNVESYYQEAGRAGRDGSPADCVLLFSPGDVMTCKYMINHGEDNPELTPAERLAALRRDLQRLERMTAYCKTDGCLRAYILGYFGEEHAGACGNCGNCLGKYTRTDVTVQAQKALSCVRRIEKRYPSGLGAALVGRVLRGSRDKRIAQLGLEQLSTYGALRGADRQFIRDILDHLVAHEYLVSTGGNYPVLFTAEKADGVLFGGERVQMPVRGAADACEAAPRASRRAALQAQRASQVPQASQASQAPQAAPDEGLYQALKETRTLLAQKARVPAYVIFSNAALQDMAAKKPRTYADFLNVSGVGEIKAARYADVFLETVRRHETEKSP